MIKKLNIAFISIALLMSFVFAGYTTKPGDVLNYFKKMKASDVKYCEFQVFMPTFRINKRLDTKEIKTFVNLLNKSKSAVQHNFPTSKGGYVGLNLYMKSGQSFSLSNVNDGFWIDYNDKRYKITQPEYEKFFIHVDKKYSAEYSAKKISQQVNYSDASITKIVFYDSRAGKVSPVVVEDKDKIDRFMALISQYVLSKRAVTRLPKGLIHKIQFYSNDKVVMDISLTNPMFLTINRNYYMANKFVLNDNIIENFLSSL
jgi:hypothetical protein